MYESFIKSIKNYTRIFFDTCTLIDHLKDVKILFKEISALPASGESKIIITLQVYRELKKHSSKRNGNLPLLKKSLDALAFIEEERKKKTLKIQGEENDDIFNDRVILYVFQKFIGKFELVLFSQDRNLGNDVLKLNEQKSENRHGRAKVFVFGKSGELFQINSYRRDIKRAECQNVKSRSKAAFKIKRQLEAGYDDSTLVQTKIPREGDYAYKKSGEKTILKKQIGRGGEGNIYEIDKRGYVAKLYLENRLTKFQQKKLSLMFANPLSIQGVCWPEELLFNEKGELVGYIMKRAEGYPLSTSVFQPQLLKKKFPTWQKKELVLLAITIFKKIRELHRNNVILGDINDSNILVVSPEEVYFVDTDSYQIEGFPCPVGTPLFCSQEILWESKRYRTLYGKERKYSAFLRTLQDEYYASAVLLFRILVPGKPPYSQTGDQELIQNILNMNFPYPCGENKSEGVPLGPWRFIWSHLPRKLKEAFYGTFQKHGIHSTPETRLDEGKWLKILNEYFVLLKTGKFKEQDPMSESLFPNRFKRQAGISYSNCTECNGEFPTNRLREGLCFYCFNEVIEEATCGCCGARFALTRGNKLSNSKKGRILSWCNNCIEHRDDIVETRQCIDCGKSFSILLKEKAFFEQKGFELPKRCLNCRSIRKL